MSRVQPSLPHRPTVPVPAMREGSLVLAAVLCALLGFALLALSQERHFTRVFEAEMAAARAPYAQRAIGFIAVVFALPLCIAAEGSGFGSLLWVVMIGAAAMAVALALTWRPHWLRWLRPLLSQHCNKPET